MMAFGFMKCIYIVGHGDIHALPKKTIFANSSYSRLVTGLAQSFHNEVHRCSDHEKYFP